MKMVNIFLAVLMILNSLPFSGIAFAAEENIALGKTAMASDMYAGTPPENAIDGSESSIWSMGWSIPLLGSKGGYDHWLGVDLGTEYEITHIVVKSRRDSDQASSREHWVIQVADNAEFRGAITVGKKPEAGEFKSDFDQEITLAKPYRYVRVCTEQYNIVVSELEVYGQLPGAIRPYVPFADLTEESSCYGAANLLKKLGVINGVTETEFGEDTLFSYEQAADFILHFVGLDQVPAQSSYAYCEKLGITNDMQIDNREAYILGNDFMYMLLNAMGHYEKIKHFGGYPNGWMPVAIDLHLGTEQTNGYISRGRAALLLYEALFVPLPGAIYGNRAGVDYSIPQGNILETVFSMAYGEGVVTANGVTDLTGGSPLHQNAICVNGDILSAADAAYGKYLGQTIRYVYDDNAIFWAWPYRNTSSTIACDTILTLARNQLTYEQDGKAKSAMLHSGFDVVKNGQLCTGWTIEEMKQSYGRLRLVDNNSDGIYECIFWDDPKIVILDQALLLPGGEIALVGLNAVNVRIDALAQREFLRNGVAVSITQAEQCSVLYCYCSENGNYAWVDIVENRFDGIVEGASDQEAVIDGNVYPLARYYKENAKQELKVGFAATMILDKEGNLIWITDRPVPGKDETLAFVQQVSQDKGIEKKLQMRVFTQQGKFEILEFADKVEVDGKRCDSSGLLDQLPDGAGYFAGHFILFRKANGKVVYLDSEHFCEETEPDSPLILDDFVFDDSLRYIPNAAGIYQKNFMVMPLKNTTTVFQIPLVGGFDIRKNYGASRAYDGDYGIITASGAFGNMSVPSVIGANHSSFYMRDSFGFPYFAVKYRQVSAKTGNSPPVITNPSAPALIVNKVSKLVDGYRFSGYSLTSGSEVTITTEAERIAASYRIYRERPEYVKSDTWLLEASKIAETYFESPAEIKKGDILRYHQSDGIVDRIERIFAYDYLSNLDHYVSSDGSLYSTSVEYPAYAGSDFRLMYGTIKNLSDGMLAMETVYRNDGDSQKHVHTLAYSAVPVFLSFDGRYLDKQKITNLSAYYRDDVRLLVLSVKGNNTAVIAYEK